MIFRIAAGYSLMTLAAVSAQSLPPTAPDVRPAPKIKILFPSGISSENVWLKYLLSGPHGQRLYVGLGGSPTWNSALPPFDPVGGQGHVVAATATADPYYELVALDDGNAVDSFKTIAWTKGCQMMTFAAEVGTSDIAFRFTCRPQKTVSLTGRLQQFEMEGKSLRLTASFGALIDPLFYGIGPGPEPPPQPKGYTLGLWGIPDIASGVVHPDGSFRIELPDFAHDPAASRDSTGHFELYLADAHKPIEPVSEDWQMENGLRIAPSYPNDFIFAPPRDPW